MIHVCFYGDLRKFGNRFKLEAVSPADALKGLMSQIDGLRAHIEKGSYQVRVGGKDFSTEDVEASFNKPTEDTVVHLVPRTSGAGKNGGVIQIVVGVIIAVVCWWNPLGWGAAAGVAGSAGAYGAGVMFGAAMVMGGITQMLTKPPKFDDKNREGQAASNSSSFSNIDNISAQGKPVPIVYGLCYVGSRVISQGVETYRPFIAGVAKDKATKIEVGKLDIQIKELQTQIKTLKAAGLKGFDGKEKQELLVAQGKLENLQEQRNKLLDNTKAQGIIDSVEINDIGLNIEKLFTNSRAAATAPNGQTYNTDFQNDSVRARNYIAKFKGVV